MRARRLSALVATLALTSVLAACGVSTSGSPRAISRSLVPSSPPPAVTTTVPSDDIQVTIVLLNAASNSTVPVARYVPQQLDNLHTVVSDLLLGPAEGDVVHGLFSAIPAGTKLIGISPDPAGTPGLEPSMPVTVNLTLDFSDVSGLSQVLAIEQVVFTVECDLTSTTRVLFEIEGVPQDVPVLGGGLVDRAVSATDYLAPGATLDCSTG